MRIPDRIPVMVLGGATLYPHGYMPLFIFEMRYREMLRYILERDRMFCIGHAFHGIDPDATVNPVHRITTVGLVRACVTHPDGTSHLMLSGIQRAEIVGWDQHHPFRIARIIPRPCHVTDTGVAISAALELVDLSGRLCGEGKIISDQLREHLRCVKDPAAIADIVGQSFVNDPCERQRLLEMDEVNERLEYLVCHLSTLLTEGKQ
ncbi:MAG: LON peptidase substrate-binding domain-containing protein [Verrucomicrobiales bacterium]|nr:LON peptidase substrate-binding domain-containing protein [Verrucomicrobiales bacterium]MBP9223113.1 LON peptidase substrate-binding domain-containing protein [Verrucomicrobiales bacterium]